MTMHIDGREVQRGIINVASTEPGIENTERASESYASRIFDLLEHWLPEYRARVFYEIERRWCWDCGFLQSEDVHQKCLTSETGAWKPFGESERETLAARLKETSRQLRNEAADVRRAGSRTWSDMLDEFASTASEAASLIERGEST